MGDYEAPSFIVNSVDQAIGYEGETYTTGTYLNTDHYLLQAGKAISIDWGFIILTEGGGVSE